MFTAGFPLAIAIKNTGITRRAEDYTDSLPKRKDRGEILYRLKEIHCRNKGKVTPVYSEIFMDL
ncbi:hypothetical protein BF17_07665 [Yersinia similis]|uniref:Uncharacterized protein n=1 Tax=Yersinia similis TaxID=367190 RepID=A0ABN4CVN3_9GAMM|nr:hypothetical protein BF17_07665 [Yersinia similis]